VKFEASASHVSRFTSHEDAIKFDSPMQVKVTLTISALLQIAINIILVV